MRYSKPFLRTSRPAANSSGTRSPTESSRRRSARDAAFGRKRSTSTPYGTVSSRERSAPRAMARSARSSLHAVTNPARRNARRAAKRAGASRLGDVDVGAVEADDERKRRRRGGRRHAAGDDPVAVHDRRAMPPRHRPRRAPSCGQRQRGRDVGGAPEAHVGPHRSGIAEHVQRPERRIAVEMKVDALLLGAARDERVPRRHDVDLVAEGRDRTGNRLHEGADAVARESRVRRRHHHDDVGHRVRAARRGAPGATA